MNTLAWVRENFVLGMALPDLIPKDVWPTLKTKHLIVPIERAAPLSLSLKAFGEKMEDPKVRDKILGAYHAHHKRAASRESYELVFTYCDEKKQLPVFRSLPWYQYARIVRHTASHGRGGFIKWPPDLTDSNIHKVTWRTFSLESSMDGQELELGAHDAYQLLLDIIEFADKNLA